MHARRAFTLIELLVVIAIIALLMAILMPTVEAVRKETKDVMCRSNLRQWGKIFMMYTMDNNGYFASASSGELWTKTLERYYSEPGLRCCPTAVKPAFPQGAANPWGGKFSAWGVFDDTFAALGLEGLYGSYGMNGYASNPSPGVTVNPWGYDTTNNWQGPDVKGGAYIPLFLDCAWLGGSPLHEDTSPEYDGQTLGGGPGGSMDEMRRFCMNRHNEGINGLFLNSSVRKIGLKELWELKWHRDWNPSNDTPPREWNNPAHWMYGMKDYAH